MIPIATTTITVRRPSSSDDPTDAPDVDTVATGHPATIGAPSGRGTFGGASSETVDAQLSCDTLPLALGDLVDDEQTDETWIVVWSRQRIGLGLDHTIAGLRRTKAGTGV